MKSDLIKRLEGHIETLRGVASSVYSDDIQEAVVALEQKSGTISTMRAYAEVQAKRIELLEALLDRWLAADDWILRDGFEISLATETRETLQSVPVTEQDDGT